MTAITSSAASETDSARNFTAGRSGATAAITASPPPSGRCTSSRTTSGSSSRMSGPASATVPASPTMSTSPAELVADAGAEQLVVIDQHDADHDSPPLGMVSSTSVPFPGDDVIVADPPARRRRASIESAIPRRSAATAAASNPTPRSRTIYSDCRRFDLGVDGDLVTAARASRHSPSPRAPRARARRARRRAARRRRSRARCA